MNILGVHIGHDSGAALIRDGQVIADASEERFNKIKHYGSYPIESLGFCLKQGGIRMGDVDAIAFTTYISDPAIKILFGLSENEVHDLIAKNDRFKTLAVGVAGVKNKIKDLFFRRLPEGAPLYVSPFKRRGEDVPIIKVEHHLAHAASTYYTSGFEEGCLIITCDGIGDDVSTAIWRGKGGRISPIARFGGNGSWGWFYGLVTEALDWWVGEGEGKTMGLAPYGNPEAFSDEVLTKYMPKYENGNLKKKVDFGKIEQLVLMGAYHWHFPVSIEVKKIVDRYGRENVAAKAQKLLEQEMKKFVGDWVRREKATRLATAGGVFLNVKLNQKIVEDGIVEQITSFPGPVTLGLLLAQPYIFTINFPKSTSFPKFKIFIGDRHIRTTRLKLF